MSESAKYCLRTSYFLYFWFWSRLFVTSPSTNTKDIASRVDNTAQIFEQHGAFILTVIRYLVKDGNKEDDMYQDFFLALVSKPVPKDIQNIRSYLYKAIINDLVDSARRLHSYKVAVNKYANNLIFLINNDSVKNAFIENEEIDRMFEVIGGMLPRSQAQAISYRYKNGYAISEIAEKMSVNSKSVSRYISVGFKTIRRLWTINKEKLPW